MYFSLRGTEYKLNADGDTDLDELWREMQDQSQEGEGQGGAGSMDALTPEEIASALAYIKSTWPDEIIETHNGINARTAVE